MHVLTSNVNNYLTTPSRYAVFSSCAPNVQICIYEVFIQRFKGSQYVQFVPLQQLP